MLRGFLASYLHAKDPTLNVEQVIIDFAPPANEALNVDLFREAWQKTANHFPALHCSLNTSRKGSPVLDFQSPAEFRFEVIDWSSKDQAAVTADFETLLVSDRADGIPLDGSCDLWRVLLLKTPTRRWTLLWTIHHGIIDGRSFAPALECVFQTYEALTNNEQPHFPPQSGFDDFCHFVAGNDWSAAKSFYLNTFENWSPQPNLKVYGPIENKKADDGGMPRNMLFHQLDQTKTATLVDGTQNLGITLNTLLQGAWAFLLSRYLRHDDIVHGAIRSGRHWGTETPDNDVGFFITNTPVRTTFDLTSTPREILSNLREQHIAVRPHEQAPLQDIQKWVNEDSNDPLFETYVMFEVGGWKKQLEALSDDWKDRSFRLIERTTPPLAISAQTVDETLEIEFDYDASKFPKASIERMMTQIANIMLRMVTSPDDLLAEWGISTPAEQEELGKNRLANSTRPDYPPLHEAYDKMVAAHGNRAALVCNGQTFTYSDLNRLANGIAAKLKSLNIGPGNRVATNIAKSPTLYASILGILKTGAAYMPIDLKYHSGRIDQMIQSGTPDLILHEKDAPSPNNHSEDVNALAIDLEQLSSDHFTSPAISSSEPANILFTSGTTGQPKAVLNTHEGIMNYITSVCESRKISPEDRITQVASIGFDIAVEEMWMAWTQGACLVVAESNLLNSPRKFQQWLEQEKITIIDIATALWQALTEALENSQFELPPSVRTVIVGGEASLRGTYDAWHHLLRDRSPSIHWSNTYGPTEAAVSVTCFNDWEHGFPDWHQEVPIGYPIKNTRIYTLDQWMHELPPGVPGQLVIGGINVAKGYLDNPEATEKVFAADTFFPNHEEQMYQTGDLGFRTEDNLFYFLGRIDRQVKIRGFRIEPADIEATIGNHPEVREVAVTVLTRNGNQDYLAAYIVLHGNTPENQHALENHIQKNLQPQARPSSITILDALPKTTNGKIDYRALPAPTATSQENPSTETSQVDQPVNMIEMTTLEIAQKVISENVTINASFREAGGDSLKIMEMVGAMEQSGLELQVDDFATDPSLRRLAALALQRTYNASEEDKHKPFTESGKVVHLQPSSYKPSFIFPYSAYGDLMLYQEWVKVLGPHFGCYGLTHPRVLKMQNPGFSLKDLCTAFTNALINSKIPEPYSLAGYCFSASLAHEVACQLVERGKKVDHLIVADVCAIVGETQSTAQHLLSELLRVSKLLFRGGTDLKRYLRSRWQGLKRHHDERKEEKAAQSIKGEFSDTTANFKELQWRIVKEHHRALSAFERRVFPGTMSIISTDDPRFRDFNDPSEGWGDAATDVKTHLLENCDHMDLVGETRVHDFIRIALDHCGIEQK